MSQHTYQGGPVMVKIDGTRIRTIRETKGLTQLYVATAVAVTTDTVSRWENRRYPSIKQENALKLAEALEVDLEEILEREQYDEAEVDDPVPPPSGRDGGTPGSGSGPRRFGALLISRARLILALVLVAFFGLMLAYLVPLHTDTPPAVTVRRIVSPHFIAGQPLPIFLQISAPADKEVSVILQETLPPGSRFETSDPLISGMDKKNNTVKWLQKISGPSTYLYIITSEPTFQGQLSFTGSLKMVAREDDRIVITGDSTAAAGLHHWADLNRDNRISDEEILRAYDLGLSDNSQGIDVDLIEEMWLGDGYIWQPDTQRFTIVE